MKKLLGKNDIEDSLKRLDTLTQEEARMATAEVLRVTHGVSDNVKLVLEAAVKLSRQDLRKWLSPPDPSTNHNTAHNARHEGTATWFFDGGIYKHWKSNPSLLWIHGKRMSLFLRVIYILLILVFIAGSGKSVIWCVVSLPILPTN